MTKPLILSPNGPALRAWLRLEPDSLPPADAGDAVEPFPVDGFMVELGGLSGERAAQGRARLLAWRRGDGRSVALMVCLHRLDDEVEVEADLDCAVSAHAEAVTAPGLGTRAGLQHVDSLLSAAEAMADRPAGGTATLALLGTDAGALLSAGNCAASSTRYRALAFDGLAAARAAGAVVADGDVMRTARGLALLAAAAAGVAPLAVISGESDRETLYRTCLDARRQGFVGAITDRPEAIAVIRDVFEPLL